MIQEPSTEPYSDKCQQVLTSLQESLEPAYQAVKNFQNQPDEPLTLTLNIDQLTLFSALWKPDAGQLIVVHNGGPRAADELSRLLEAWPRAESDTVHWHHISGELSEAELSGTIVSRLSQTIHHLLQGTVGHCFVVSEDSLGYRLPGRQVYQAAGQTWHTGQQTTLGALIRWLVQAGYQRYEATIEPGGFRVRGEQIDIWPPTETETFTVTLYRSVIESITTRQGRRTETLPRLSLWPTAFPEQLVPLAEANPESLWLTPEAASQPAQAVQYQALVPTMPFPVSAQELEQLATFLPMLRRREERPVSYEQGLQLVAELREGKPAVHADHGIGIYNGLQTRTLDGSPREYLVLQYAGGDTLSVPVEYAHKVTAYVGEETPPIGRLGGSGWSKASAQAKHDAEAYAQELLTLAGKRAETGGRAYVVDPILEEKLNESFPFELTPDQARAWQDVQSDLVAEEPMDRLIVGDVGFGKTEVAVRAARHLVANGKQVAVLAPTTLLAQQHTDTFKQRLPDLADQLVTLSRFSTPAEQRAARQRISGGEAMIAIGTHALLAQSTTWHDLGLVIIDEEQRFGVTQKEHFKKLRANVDLLSLSATPIPRTLSMALASIKQLSVISTAPTGRQDVTTVVGQASDEVLSEAIQRELERGGQVYVVAPKVRQLPALAKDIQRLLPEASVAVAHGQLAPKQLAEVMQQFDTGQLQVLVSSSIIENGIDLPNANTIIVTHATHFGLADLYQLRGRVGRRDRQGYAYFLYSQHEMSSQQRQRLTALVEASRLGSGWSLAQRDLEIRGAGNMLGAEQSGTVNAVGVQLYLDLVQEALQNETEPLVRRHDVDIQLPLPAVIPQHYISEAQERTRAYQRLARARDDQLLQKAWRELVTQYGEPPLETYTLYSLIRLQHAAAQAGITAIKSTKISPPDEDPYDRLILQAKHLPNLLQKVQPLGNFEVRDDTLTLDVDALTPGLVDQLIEALYA